MNKKTRIITLSVLAIMIVICVSLGITKAFMKPVEDTSSITEVSLSSCAKISLTDKGSINLSNTYPMSKNRALNTTPYSFTVTSSCDGFVGFNLYIATFNTNTLDASKIHYIITEVGSKDIISEGLVGEATDVTSSFTDQEKTEYNVGMKGNVGTIYQVYNANIPLKGSKSYDLYLYVDEEATNVTAGQTFNAGIAVKSYDREEVAYHQECSDDSMACTIAKKYTDGSNGLYYHNDDLVNGAGDNSYRYSGANPNNYVCFGSNASNCPEDNLYRIIGVFNETNADTGATEQRVKLIKADYANEILLGSDGDRQANMGYNKSSSTNYKGNINFVHTFYWNYISSNTTKNTWSESKLNTVNLNTNLINHIGTNWSNLIANNTWNVGGSTLNDIILYGAKTAYVSESNSNSGTYNSKIGLLYMNEYYYAADPLYWTYAGYKNGNDSIQNEYSSAKNDNWMFLGLFEYSITTANWNAVSAFRIASSGNASWTAGYNPSAIRPTFSLNADVAIESGEGTIDSPYRLVNEKKTTPIKAEIKSYSRNETTLTMTPRFTLGANSIATVYYQISNDGVWHESGNKSVGYSFSGLTKNTTYNIKIKAVDADGITSNIGSYNLTTYLFPTLTLTSTSKTANSITVNVTGTNGTKNIGKYMYSINGGTTWVTKTSSSTTDSYTFTGLTSATSYTIKVRIADSSGSYTQNNDITTTVVTD